MHKSPLLEISELPAPQDTFLAVLNYLALAVLAQLTPLAKRVLADAS